MLKDITNKLEDSIVTISGPALAVSGIIAGVDLLMGGAIMTQIHWMSLAWAICLMISLDFQVLSLGARAHKIYLSDKAGRRKALEIALAVILAAFISSVSIQMQSIIARANSVPALSIADATAQLGINPVWLVWERSTTVLLLIFTSGWLREEVVPAGNTSSNTGAMSEETMQHILARLAKVDELERTLNRDAQPVTIVPEPETPAQIPETPVTKQAATQETMPETEAPSAPLALLPAVSGVSPEDVKSVVDAYLAGIAKREICSHLRWGSGKYSRIVKPTLDAFLAQYQS